MTFYAETRNLVLQLKDRRPIDGVDLRLREGPLTVIMGPNGAGKSLLLRLLHGMINATEGDILWHGKALTPDDRLRQAMVFQRPVLLRRSVAANIDFVLKLRGTGSPARRQNILAGVGLAELAGQPARHLSGGEQQRLALARALAIDPEVLFLDEPTASLDPASTLAIEQAVLAAHARGTHVVFVTHDVGQAKRLAGEIVFMHKGRIIEQSAAGAFFDQPKSDAARHYLAGQIII
jgi:tungstate transport system ATP-binding protein